MAEVTTSVPASQSAAEGLRQRNAPLRANTSEEARQTVLDLNAAEETSDKLEKDRKTFGRTPDGTGTSTPCDPSSSDLLTSSQSSLCLSHMTWSRNCCRPQSLKTPATF